MKLSNTLMAVAALCVAGPGLKAQSFRYTADVPFSFHVANTELKAGAYIVEKPINSSVEWMTAKDHSQKLAVASGPQSLEKAGGARLVFHRRDSGYYLAEIWNDQGRGTALPRSKADRERHQIAAATDRDAVTVYLASVR